MDTAVSAQFLSAFPPAFMYVGVFIMGFLANMVIPVPEELVFIGAGYLVGSGTLSLFPTIACIIAGLLINDIVLYTLARRGNKMIRSVYDKIFADILSLDSPFLHKHIRTVIISSRFLVQLRFLGPFFAGTLHVPLKKFIRWDFFALLAYVPLLVGVGTFFQSRVERIVGGLGSVRNIIVLFLTIILLIILMKYAKKAFIAMYKMVNRSDTVKK